jgi:hypothetical protein
MFGVSLFNSSRRISRSGAILFGGMADPGTQTAAIQKFYFSVETGAVIGTHTSPLYGAWGATHVGNAGYTLAGYGYDGNNSYAVQDDAKVVYATNTITTLGAPYGSLTKVNDSAGSDSGTKSLSFSGYDVATSGWSTSGKRWVFSTESAQTSSATMSSARANTFTMSNSSNKLYIHGGNQPSIWYCDTNIVDRVVYSTETRSSFYISSSKAKDTAGSAYSNNNVAGYSMSGLDGDCSNGSSGVATTEKLTYATETTAVSNMGALSFATYSYPNYFSNAGVAGYRAGARDSTLTQKLDFATDTFFQIPGTMGANAAWGGNMVDSLGN